MRVSLQEIQRHVREVLGEIDIGDVGDVCFTGGSTHVMKTCKIGEDKYFLKFSDESLFDESDPSLQILVEYMAYKIYSLYGLDMPAVQLVWDKQQGKVGLASAEVKGKMAGSTIIDPEKLGKMLSAGVYVDIFLANWDVIGTGDGNVVVNKDKATRIDPGGSLTFRAQGTKKGAAFGDTPGELQTMMDPNMGAGEVFQHADLRQAGETFVSVPWDKIFAKMVEANNSDIVPELKQNGMTDLLAEWKSEILHIAKKLENRHKEVLKHIQFAVGGR
jgi:hypothetical protein